jgi:hypothetical protein
VAERRPDPFATGHYEIIARGHVQAIAEDGMMTIRVDKVLKGQLKDKMDIRMPREEGSPHTVVMSRKTWAWLEVCRQDDPVFLYWGHNPSVDLLVRGAATAAEEVAAITDRKEVKIMRFHCGDWEFFQGSIPQYEEQLH